MSVSQTPSTPTGRSNAQEQQSALRRSARNTTPTRRPGMVAPASDSRRSVTIPTSATQPPLSSQISQSDIATSQSNPKKRKAPSSVASTVASVAKHNNLQKPARGPSLKTQSKKATKADGTADDNVIDLAQDSDEANSKIVKRRRTNRKDDGFDSVLLYFSAPYHTQGDDLKLAPITYNCLHCTSSVRGARHTNANLVSHRDGSHQQGRNTVGCPKRAEAIKAGAKLPLTVAQTLQSNDTNNNKKIDSFFCPTEKFDNLVLNRVLTIWLIRNALAWSRVEDLALQSAFYYAQPSSKIYMRKWQAQSAQSLYLDLRDTMISRLQENDSRFTLIHDVWTTKGNRFGFIGATVTYINQDWDYVVNHLTLKLVAWHHKGAWLAEPVVNVLRKHQLHKKITQTTDSGSNNNTMAKEMFSQLTSLGDVAMTWDPKTMHIKCICHKLALIVSAGLKELGMRTAPPPKVRRGILGPFPLDKSLATVAEEEEYETEPEDATQVEEAGSEGGDKSKEESDEDEEEEEEEEDLEANGTAKLKDPVATAASGRRQSNELNELTISLDFVIRKIAGSAPWRQKYKLIAMQKGLKVLDLIAGYGIWWNIKYESRMRAYNAREVIDEMLKEEFDKHVAKKSCSRRTDKSKPGFFKEIIFDSHDWSMIKDLNDELEPFAIITKEMEGDGLTGALVLPKYYILKQNLVHKKNESNRTDPMYPMFAKMAEKLETYLDEALACETLVAATLLHPAFRLAAFEEFFPEHKAQAERTLVALFQARKTSMAAKKSAAVQTTDKDQDTNPPNPRSKIFNLFHSSSTKAENDELTVYLKGGEVFEMDAEDTRSALIWWKERQGKYPIMSSLARDYLACSASSCAAERTFSAAADVCSGNRGKLLPRTIEMCVSSRMWLKNEVPVTGNFEAANNIVQKFTAFKEKNRFKTIEKSSDTTAA
ncbi:hypothetical protein PSTG_04543 [Puccinia striiformis f. sp. tritici PST-78]|uniref:HAT C-terminal dimerisation domain-containing protein n=1 Tax=Puccinia striiformis f. sp. tritici PST-78 TaxID=1165861 RepID=A0A0L0VST3_9BASI|nr:hypothetical protein PSTG_04543 [Puccinia striiformis f. sp. tritici PST-78]